MGSMWPIVLGLVVVDVAYIIFRYVQNRRPPPPAPSNFIQQPLLADETPQPSAASEVEDLHLEDQLSLSDQSSVLSFAGTPAPPNSPVMGGSMRSSSSGSYNEHTPMLLQYNFSQDRLDQQYATSLSLPSHQPLLFSDVILDSPYASPPSSPLYDRVGFIGYVDDPRVEDSADSPFSLISLGSAPTPTPVPDPAPALTMQQQVTNGFYKLRKLGGF